jgi:tetratricopeptide (TPR) repeat protein
MPRAGSGYHVRGQCYLDRKEYEKASSDFTQAIGLNAKDNISYRGRGMARTHLKSYKSAFDDLTTAINMHKEAFGTADGEAHYYRGCLNNIAKNYEAALAI